MPDKVKVSVVIPMYNCGKYVPHLLESILKQTLQDFEVLCVVDGATDTTLDEVNVFASKDGRVRCFSKENGGAGTARNLGMDHASGEYVMFLDADDLYAETLLEKMVSAADACRADITVCLYSEQNLLLNKQRENLGFDEAAFPENTAVNPKETTDLYLQVSTGPTNKLFRRAFIEEKELRFSATRVANDVFFDLAALSCAGRITGVHESLIAVRKHSSSDSITSNRGKHSEDSLYVMSDLYSWLKENGLEKDYLNTFCHVFSVMMSYNAGFGENSHFTKKAVLMLNEEEPFALMPPSEVSGHFRNRLDTVRMEMKIRELRELVENRVTSLDVPNPEESLKRLISRRNTITMIKAESVVKYGRDFDADRISGQMRKYERKTTKLEKQLDAQVRKVRRLKKKLKAEEETRESRDSSLLTGILGRFRRG